MGDMTTKERLVLACFIIVCAFGSIAWIGGRTIVKTLDNVDKNTEFRITQIERDKAVERRLQKIESRVELLPEIYHYIQQWESVKP